MYVVFSNAFNFLSSMPKQKGVITTIYQRIGKGKDPSYGNYLGWISLALAKRFRWCFVSIKLILEYFNTFEFHQFLSMQIAFKIEWNKF